MVKIIQNVGGVEVVAVYPPGKTKPVNVVRRSHREMLDCRKETGHEWGPVDRNSSGWKYGCLLCGAVSR